MEMLHLTDTGTVVENSINKLIRRENFYWVELFQLIGAALHNCGISHEVLVCRAL